MKNAVEATSKPVAGANFHLASCFAGGAASVQAIFNMDEHAHFALSLHAHRQRAQLRHDVRLNVVES